jgi:hypothetical protein
VPRTLEIFVQLDHSLFEPLWRRDEIENFDDAAWVEGPIAVIGEACWLRLFEPADDG